MPHFYITGPFNEEDSSYDPSKTPDLTLPSSGINHPYYLSTMWHFQDGILACGGFKTDYTQTSKCVHYSMSKGKREEYRFPDIPNGGRWAGGASFIGGR